MHHMPASPPMEYSAPVDMMLPKLSLPTTNRFSIALPSSRTACIFSLTSTPPQLEIDRPVQAMT